jgi:hypothetical protein
MRVAFALLSAAAAAADWSYYCLGATHGCVLSQHEVTPLAGFYSSLVECEAGCPIFGKDLSWECTDSGNCEISDTAPNPKENKFATFEECSGAPSGKCFAPGARSLAYECHGPHFGCVVKEGAKADGKTLFETFDECATACHRVPDKMSFGCAGTRPNSCVLVDHAPDAKEHYFGGFDECSEWCKGTPGVEMLV